MKKFLSTVFSGCSQTSVDYIIEQTTQTIAEENVLTATNDNIVGNTEPVTISGEVQEMAEDTKEAVAS